MRGIFKFNILGSALLVFVLALFFSLYTQWTNDAIAYKFMSPVFDERESSPVMSIGDVWDSQIDHYFTTNGRFTVHFLVQLFCGLVGKTAFAVCNALVWVILLFLLVRICGVGGYIRSGFYWLVAISLWILFVKLPVDPPFQINYVWVAAATCGWLLMFFSKTESKVRMVLVFVLSILCGQMHEGFSIPLSAGVLAFACRKRFRLTRIQLVSGIAYGIGALLVIFAPGNFVRLSMTADNHDISIMHFVAMSMPVYIILIFLFIVKYCSERFYDKSNDKKDILGIMYCSAVVSYVLCCFLNNFDRPAIPLYFFLIIIILSEVSLRKSGWIPPVALALFLYGMWITYDKFISQNNLNRFSDEIREKYKASANGVIYVDQDDLIANKDEVLHYRWAYTKEARAEFPHKQDLVIRPEWMNTPEFEKDTNLVVQVAPQAWIIMQSKSKPYRFIVDKVILPFILDIRMPERELEITQECDVAFDTIGGRRVGLYINKRPYLKSRVRMIQE